MNISPFYQIAASTIIFHHTIYLW